MGFADWLVVAVLCFVFLAVGLIFCPEGGKTGGEQLFPGNRSLPLWAIGLSNTATYQSGNGAFVMLVLVFGLLGNWMWWASWIIWMPLVAIIWARMWRRMQIVTTAELITLRYGGKSAIVARKTYAFLLFCYAVIIISYITGFFAKTAAPLIPLSEAQILLLFGGVTAIYTIFGGLMGVVFTDVIQFFILFIGNLIFLFLAIPQHGGWQAISARAQLCRPESLQQFPPTTLIPVMTVAVLVIQGLFFAGPPGRNPSLRLQAVAGPRLCLG